MPNPTQIKRISEVAKELANGKKREYILGKYGKKWEISRTSIDRLLEKAKPEAERLRNLATETANDTIISETKEAVRNGLKSKNDMLLYYQREINIMQKQLTGKVPFTWLNQAKIMQSHNDSKFMLPVEKQNAIREMIDCYQLRLAKLQGFDAPTSIKHTGIDLIKLTINPAPNCEPLIHEL